MNEEVLFEKLLEVALKIGKVPSRTSFELLASPELQVFASAQYPSWSDALSDFEAWVVRNHPNSPLLRSLHERPNEASSPKRSGNMIPTPSSFGMPLKIRGMRYAPLNEIGVVYLFGVLANDLGFAVEGLRPTFPDCEAKRLVDPRRDVWQQVRVEFEYRSAGFRAHIATAAQCDLLVCWEHNWPGCPVEVLELRDFVS
jgi:hypothetical protein